MLTALPDAVARCGAVEITADQVRRVMLPQLRMARAAGKRVTMAGFREDLLALVQFLIDHQLLKQYTAEAGYAPEVESATRQLRSLEQQVGKTRFEANLEQQGLTWDEAVEHMAEELAISRWVDEKIAPVHRIEEEEARYYYDGHPDLFRVPETVQVSHILIAAKPGATEAQRKRALKQADKLLKKLRRGADFAALARKKSDCSSAQNGGDLGCLAYGDMMPELARAVASLQSGELSEAVETSAGIHILRKGDGYPAHVRDYADVREQLFIRLQRQRNAQTLRSLTGQARESTTVEILIPEP